MLEAVEQKLSRSSAEGEDLHRAIAFYFHKTFDQDAAQTTAAVRRVHQLCLQRGDKVRLAEHALQAHDPLPVHLNLEVAAHRPSLGPAATLRRSGKFLSPPPSRLLTLKPSFSTTPAQSFSSSSSSTSSSDSGTGCPPTST
eukprot:180541-Hanusia_phi.AAC.2